MTKTTRVAAILAATALLSSLTSCSSNDAVAPTATTQPTSKPQSTPTKEAFDATKLDQMSLDEILAEFSAQKTEPDSVEVLEIVQRLITRAQTDCNPTLEGKQLLSLLEMKATADKKTSELGADPSALNNGMEFYLAWAGYAAMVDGLCGPHSQL
ncbi:hypothetical protein G7068_13850 [Leucobacter viscericola]|uniref:DUF732 domain-containing protein n=1 Tax=Leucobacter viscericola TaxID=2714935 RepID=A0A6G7XI24_9MICO|nr:hypothetical protein [Leucobacter viscericola]QIK64162.1 hypothetical protein G7068_13850 [Leucobacter viscericola]